MAQIYPIEWKLALLRQNPFLNTPPSHPEEAVWAGFPDLRKQLDALFIEALSSSRTQVILNRGEYGSGKTHAAIFCRRKDYLAHFQNEEKVESSEIIYIRTPKEPEKADVMLYQNIIEALRFKQIRTVIKSIITEYGTQIALEKLQELVASEPLGKALWLLGHERSRPNQLTLLQNEDIMDERQKLLESYFFSQVTKSDLKRLGLSRGIDSTQDRFQMLSSIVQCFIGLDNTEDIKKQRRFILWIDEMEDLILYQVRYYRPFTQGLRDLIDHLPSYFTLIMNFTLASPESLEDIGTVLGKALMDRITKQIYFREPNEHEAFEYVKELMRQYRTEDFQRFELSGTYPFTEDALRTLIANLPVRTPRDINQRCADILEEALKQGIIRSKGEDTISVQFVRDVEDQRVEFDMR